MLEVVFVDAEEVDILQDHVVEGWTQVLVQHVLFLQFLDAFLVGQSLLAHHVSLVGAYLVGVLTALLFGAVGEV